MKPLEGLRILDLTRMVAGGMAGLLLADFGADVVKVEQPGAGDPLRHWTTQGLPLWWKVYGRNKRCITLNLSTQQGRELLLKLLPRFDVLMESFVPGTMERWGLGWNDLCRVHRGLIVLRVSGWGRTGPGSQRPGFGSLVEAGAGLAAVTGEADGPPLLPSAPLADMTAGLYSALAVMFALYHRDTNKGQGQTVDVSLFESLFSVLGPWPAEYAALGMVRSRAGSQSINAGPRGTYRTRDGYWIAVSGSTPKMAERFLKGYSLGHLLQEERFATNEARVAHAEELNSAIREVIGQRTLAENLAIIERENLTAYPIQTIREIENDRHFRSLPLVVDIPNGDDGPVRMHDVIPRLSQTPGEIRWPGAALGADNVAIYCDELGLSRGELEKLQEEGVI